MKKNFEKKKLSLKIRSNLYSINFQLHQQFGTFTCGTVLLCYDFFAYDVGSCFVGRMVCHSICKQTFSCRHTRIYEK
jgi:hypothetical protein